MKLLPKQIEALYTILSNDLTARMNLANILLKCPTMQDDDTRDSIISNLPDNISSQIQRSSTARTDVFNMVSRLLDYSDALPALLEIIRFFEGDSLPMQNVDALILSLAHPVDASVNHDGEPEPEDATEISRWSDKLFVNRKRQLDGLDYMLVAERARQFMIIEAEKDMGKSWLILEMRRLAEEHGISQVIWEFSSQTKDYVSLIVEAGDMLTAGNEDEFKAVNELIMNLGLNTIQNDKKLLAQYQLKIMGEFIASLERLTQNQRILFLLDGLELATPFTKNWVVDLLTRISYKKLTNVFFVIAARKMPRLGDPIESVAGRTGLSAFKPEHVKNLLELIKEICPDVDFSENAEELHRLTKGHPGRLGSLLDKKLVLQLEQEASVNWMAY